MKKLLLTLSFLLASATTPFANSFSILMYSLVLPLNSKAEFEEPLGPVVRIGPFMIPSFPLPISSLALPLNGGFIFGLAVSRRLHRVMPLYRIGLEQTCLLAFAPNRQSHWGYGSSVRPVRYAFGS